MEVPVVEGVVVNEVLEGAALLALLLLLPVLATICIPFSALLLFCASAALLFCCSAVLLLCWEPARKSSV
ncbi:MAG: hypothetical protein GC172_09295 [Phycisphaera sp.]|nr:hypothetical protein [Phycisphaera sp.]